ncbi:MAG: GWxTD domain-containing protein, partial [Candidatus Hydrothermia bacterium]
MRDPAWEKGYNMSVILSIILASDLIFGEAMATVTRLPQPADTTLYIVRVVFPGAGLVFKRDQNAYAASYEIGVDVRQGKRVAYTDYRRFSLVSKTPFPPEDTVLVHDIHLYLPDGNYTFKLRAIDLNSQKLLLEKSLKVKSMEKGPRVGDPLLVEKDTQGLSVAGIVERDTMLFLLTARTMAQESLQVRWSLVWESERIDLLADSLPWVLSGIDDTLIITVPSHNLSAGQFLFRVEITRRGKTFCRRDVRFWRVGINLLSSREFKGVISVLEFLYPGKAGKLKKSLPKDREKAWEEFWREIDPTPETDFNEAMDLFISRYPTARENYRRFDGAIADMGKIYVKYGPPDEIER